ncbi:MAG: hypothetical protein V3T05_03260, partial [Myxococcota bacterium]
MADIPMIHGTPFSVLWLIPALPLLGAAINGLFGARLMRTFGPRANHTIAIVLPSISLVIAVVAFFKLLGLSENQRVLTQNL